MDPCARGRPPASWSVAQILRLSPDQDTSEKTLESTDVQLRLLRATESKTNRCVDWEQALNAPHWFGSR
ncbi:hypothetical protein T06_11832 [Trichinella sp. T6]|nr:hypothetical protein T06_11832 [Trichinella sp. T6]